MDRPEATGPAEPTIDEPEGGRLMPHFEDDIAGAMAFPPVTRREFLLAGTAAVAVAALPRHAVGQTGSGSPLQPVLAKVALTVNGEARELEVDTRTTLLDALREHLHLTGSKKGCDHGQCGACTVIAGGRRINSCLTL